jgi:hypothetical protein
MQVRERDVVAGYGRTECSYGWLGWGQFGMIQQPCPSKQPGAVHGYTDRVSMSGISEPHRSAEGKEGYWNSDQESKQGDCRARKGSR